MSHLEISHTYFPLTREHEFLLLNARGDVRGTFEISCEDRECSHVRLITPILDYLGEMI